MSTQAERSNTPPKPRKEAPKAVPFEVGDVFAGVGLGHIYQYRPFTSTIGANFVADLNTGSGSDEQTGMCFDPTGNLYSTNHYASTMSRFNNLGVLIDPIWASGFQFFPESCVQDANGDFYVGEVSPLGQPNTPNRLRKFNIAGQQLAAFNPEKDLRGIDWIDLAADNCTIYYTSESDRVMRFNVCTNTQINGVNNPWVANLDGVTGVCYALRIRPNGEVMVACSNNVYRLDANGTILHIYPKPLAEPSDFRMFAMNLDPNPDPVTGDMFFWTGIYQNGHIYKININTGAVVNQFTAQGIGSQHLMSGLAVYGELRALATPTATPTHTATSTATQTATSTVVPPSVTTTATATESATPTPSGPTPTPTATVCVNDTCLGTATVTPTPKPTFTPTRTGTATNTPTSTPGGTHTPTNTPTGTTVTTRTPTKTPNVTAFGTRTPTQTPTGTAVGTRTPTNTPTGTAVSETRTPTNTPTRTAVSETRTPTNTPTNTRVVETRTPTNTPTNTRVSTRTPTRTPTNTPVGTHTPTKTPTNTPVGTHTPTNTPVATRTSTRTPTNTPVGTRTPTKTPTRTATPTRTPVTCSICNLYIPDVNIECNADGTVHWSAVVRNNASCVAVSPWRVQLQSQRNYGSFRTVQTQTGNGTFPPGDTLLEGDFCATFAPDITFIRVAFALTSDDEFCNPDPYSGMIPPCNNPGGCSAAPQVQK
jgi:hypothetical protein